MSPGPDICICTLLVVGRRQKTLEEKGIKSSMRQGICTIRASIYDWSGQQSTPYRAPIRATSRGSTVLGPKGAVGKICSPSMVDRRRVARRTRAGQKIWCGGFATLSYLSFCDNVSVGLPISFNSNTLLSPKAHNQGRLSLGVALRFPLRLRTVFDESRSIC
jgi:hypothetical protein